MKIDLEHFHHWMIAVRKSKDPMRTMDAFWRGQMRSKEWLIEELKKHIGLVGPWPSIDIHGGWVGTLSSLLFQSDLYIKHINSIDIDCECEDIARSMNQIELEAGKFRAITADMCTFKGTADIVINTSFEHIIQEQYEQWLLNIPEHSLIVLQSNNYEIPEHVRIAKSLDEFIEQSKLNVIWSGELELPLYKRFMIIGKHDTDR
jgi:hypothetical protein